MNSDFELFVKENESKIKLGSENIVKDSWIKFVEENISFELPDSYKWFVKKYEFIEIGYESIKIIAPPEFRDDCDMDIFYSYKTNIESKILSANKLSIMESAEGDEIYYFLAEKGIIGNEYKIYKKDSYSHTDCLFANNFLGFIKLKIEEHK